MRVRVAQVLTDETPNRQMRGGDAGFDSSVLQAVGSLPNRQVQAVPALLNLKKAGSLIVLSAGKPPRVISSAGRAFGS